MTTSNELIKEDLAANTLVFGLPGVWQLLGLLLSLHETDLLAANPLDELTAGSFGKVIWTI